MDGLPRTVIKQLMGEKTSLGAKCAMFFGIVLAIIINK